MQESSDNSSITSAYLAKHVILASTSDIQVKEDATVLARDSLKQHGTSSLRKKIITKDLIGRPVLIATSMEYSSTCVDLTTRI